MSCRETGYTGRVWHEGEAYAHTGGPGLGVTIEKEWMANLSFRPLREGDSPFRVEGSVT